MPLWMLIMLSHWGASIHKCGAPLFACISMLALIDLDIACKGCLLLFIYFYYTFTSSRCIFYPWFRNWELQQFLIYFFTTLLRQADMYFIFPDFVNPRLGSTVFWLNFLLHFYIKQTCVFIIPDFVNPTWGSTAFWLFL